MGSSKTAADGERSVALRIVVTPMPPRAWGALEEVELFLQDGASEQLGAERPDGARVFETRVRVRRNAATGRPNFLGSSAHGTPAARFLYLCWEGIEDGRPIRFGRMELHLSPITWEQIDRVANGRGILEATVSGVSDRGRPACASVPLHGEGWHVIEA